MLPVKTPKVPASALKDKVSSSDSNVLKKDSLACDIKSALVNNEEKKTTQQGPTGPLQSTLVTFKSNKLLSKMKKWVAKVYFLEQRVLRAKVCLLSYILFWGQCNAALQCSMHMGRLGNFLTWDSCQKSFLNREWMCVKFANIKGKHWPFVEIQEKNIWIIEKSGPNFNFWRDSGPKKK